MLDEQQAQREAIHEISVKLARVEGRCDAFHGKEGILAPAIRQKRDAAAAIRFAVGHWKLVAAFIGFITLWFKSSSGNVDPKTIEYLKKAVDAMLANW